MNIPSAAYYQIPLDSEFGEIRHWALLFSNAKILAKKIEIDVSLVQQVIDNYTTPEEINDDPANAPSERLEALKNGYRKVAIGKTVSESIGIEGIRKQCTHFNNWLTSLENLKELRT